MSSQPNLEDGSTAPKNPIEPSETLQQPPPEVATIDAAHPPQPIQPEDSAVTKAEKIERHGAPGGESEKGEFEDPPAKRVRLDETSRGKESTAMDQKPQEPAPRKKGVASIKAEYLIDPSMLKNGMVVTRSAVDDDAAEGAKHADQGRGEEQRGKRGDKKDKKQRGQNTARQFGSSKDALQLCSSVAIYNEFEAKECRFGDKCKFEHNLRKYLSEGKRPDLETFKICPIYEARGKCNAGWKCRLVSTHSEEKEHPDGRKELVLKEDPERIAKLQTLKNADDEELGNEVGNVNVVSAQAKIDLNRRKTKTPKSDAYLEYLNKCWEQDHGKEGGPQPSSIRVAEAASVKAEPAEETPAEKGTAEAAPANGDSTQAADTKAKDARDDHRASYISPPLLPSEKRRLYYGPETPVLAPLTTQGNLPFRRLCVSLGAQVTWSEMAMSLPLIQGNKSEWALAKAHESEATPPAFSAKNTVVDNYDNGRDMKFGVQIAGNKPWNVLKATEVLTALCPHLRAIDLNCGCPIDLVYRQGAGSALLDARGKLEKMLRGMVAVSNEVPITVKIRMGVKDNEPTADRLVERVVLGSQDARASGEGPCGVAAITLHGRSRQQRYTRSADWGYISETAALISRLHKQQAELADTANDVDPRHLPNGGKVYFVGNGDCYSHADYHSHMDTHKVDSVMVARGALIKPWVFEEIQANQYLDKSSSERLRYVEDFVRFGLETWGSDEMGVGTTRRFLLEWLSFACRYTPVGLLEHLPPNIQDRAPAFRGRDDLETLMASDNYRDWIKISDMFLGKAPESFKFEPKHKSNAYEAEG